MNAPRQLTDALFAARSRPRGDEADAHVADLYACDRATWYRRNGYAPEPFTREKLAQFAIGHGYEREVASSLREAGYMVEQNGEVTICGLTGHPDIVLYAVSADGEPLNFTVDEVVEVKTTEAGTPKPEVSAHHAIQVAAYALARGASKARVLVKHARSHVEAEYVVNPEDWRERIVARADEIHARTAKGAPMPPAEPGDLAPWGCKYCDFRMCERNPNHIAFLEAALDG